MSKKLFILNLCNIGCLAMKKYIKLRIVIKRKPAVLDVEGKTILKSLNDMGFEEVVDCHKGSVIDLLLNHDHFVKSGDIEQNIKKFVSTVTSDILVNEIIDNYEYSYTVVEN